MTMLRWTACSRSAGAPATPTTRSARPSSGTSGELGLVDEQLEKVADDDPRLQPTLIRNAAVQTMGNLTIITQRLNSSNSNVAWAEKRQDLLLHALLPINRDLQKYDAWDESSITTRGEALLEHALKIWPRN